MHQRAGEEEVLERDDNRRPVPGGELEQSRREPEQMKRMDDIRRNFHQRSSDKRLQLLVVCEETVERDVPADETVQTRTVREALAHRARYGVGERPTCEDAHFVARPDELG